MYVISEEGGHCIVVDPCDTEEALSAVAALHADFIFLTHEHFDHISGTSLLAEKTGAPVVCGELCADRLSNPVLNCSRHFNAFAIMRRKPCSIRVTDYRCSADRTISHKQTLDWYGHVVTFLHTPGHLDSCFSLLIDGMLFTGDAVILAEDGSLAKCDRHYVDMYRDITLPLLEQLLTDTRILPGHGEPFALNGITPKAGM